MQGKNKVNKIPAQLTTLDFLPSTYYIYNEGNISHKIKYNINQKNDNQ